MVKDEKIRKFDYDNWSARKQKKTTGSQSHIKIHNRPAEIMDLLNEYVCDNFKDNFQLQIKKNSVGIIFCRYSYKLASKW